MLRWAGRTPVGLDDEPERDRKTRDEMAGRCGRWGAEGVLLGGTDPAGFMDPTERNNRFRRRWGEPRADKGGHVRKRENRASAELGDVACPPRVLRPQARQHPPPSS